MKRLIPLIFILIIAYLGVQAYSLSKVDVTAVEFDKISRINTSGFMLEGYVSMVNEGILNVRIDHIDYQIVLDQTDEVLSRGSIQGKKIMPKEEGKFDTSAFISWNPAKDAAVGLLLQDETNATVSGDAYVSLLGFIETKIPFEEKVDLKPYFKEAIGNKINDIVKGIFG